MKQAFEDIQNEGYDNDEFSCDGCGMDGSGVRYHCKQCGFDLHEDCATCPEHLTSYIHPNHPLQRMWEGPENDYGQSRPCDCCGDQVKGLYYKCASGAAEKRYDDGQHYFFIHPVCSKLPLQVRHAIDESHPLKLQSVPVIPDAWCAICRKIVSSSSWSYRCDPCGVNIHPQCVTLPYVTYQPVRNNRPSQRQQVAQAESNADALAAAMYAAKMSAKTNKFILKHLI
ncbi:hypothetical protein MKW94_013126 [Papaver nudicaule]|uniref:Phorbol-ester/DAG-type domain-containing protein n=1 Tax=Papaver nudicaule TaxID=74823 RepID=A0AA41S476_PAPNU|nr:hypothetical protein [Papaver nudicaule]